MIAISLPLGRRNWNTMSFPSTLYLCPVLELLLAKVPLEWQAEIRLGLQEALVNAAKHGNKLDPSKSVIVEFYANKQEYSWVITDQGSGFIGECSCSHHKGETLPPEESENGRGLCILHAIFDQVHWNTQGTQILLSKQIKKSKRTQPLLC